MEEEKPCIIFIFISITFPAYMTADFHVNICLYLVYLCHLIIGMVLPLHIFTFVLIFYCVFLLLMFPARYLCCFCRFLMALYP